MGQRGPDQPQEQRAGAPPERPAPPSTAAEQAQLKTLQRQRQERVVKVSVALAIVVILIIFVIANSDPVKVNFVFASRHPRLIWVMIACAVLGGIAGYLIGRPGRHPRGRRQARDQQQR